MSRPIGLIYKSLNPKFESTLRQRVEAHLSGRNRKGDRWTLVKAVGLIALVIGLYTLAVFSEASVPLRFLILTGLGFAMLLLGLNVLHEACHGNLSTSPRINRWLGYGFDVFGGISSEQYRFKHNVVHHRYTNMNELDGDLVNLDILRLAPGFRRMNLHRLQWLYAPILYALLTVTWGFNDIERLFTRKVSSHAIPPFKFGSIAMQLGLKVLYVLVALVVPAYHVGLGPTLLGFLYVHALMGLMIALVFQVAHTVELCDFPEVGEGTPSLRLNEGYAEHQLRTTANFAHGPLGDFVFGGLNYQIEHHLFPSVSARHLPSISRIVRATCREFGVGYNYFPTFGAAVRSHFRHLVAMGHAGEI